MAAFRKTTDQIGRTVTIPDPADLRIVSLVPSQTELLFDLGLDKQVVGITRFCVSPKKWQLTKAMVGGTKTIKMGVIQSLKPNLVIANKEENIKEQIETLSEKYAVWTSNVSNLEEALGMIRDVSEITGKEETGNKLTAAIDERFKSLHVFLKRSGHIPSRAAYFIWRQPYMVAGGDSFISDMIKSAGYENVFQDMPRYPEVTPEEIRRREPEVILLSSEPYLFQQKHFEEFIEICPQARVKLVDGAMFSWYGSRLREAPEYFRQLLT